jgi:hypothetical protein
MPYKTPAMTMICAHTGKPAVQQRSPDDCMICALAMLTGRTYEEVVAAAVAQNPAFPVHGPMSHSILRSVAHGWGFMLLSGIYMLWGSPGIVGVLSPDIPGTGHAVFWDGEKIIDPKPGGRVDRAYVDAHGLEFTQRASDLLPLADHELALAAARTTDEPF